MTAFTLIPGAWFDPFDMICSLQRRMGLFKDGPSNGQRLLWLRQHGKSRDLTKWPEIGNMLSQIERFGDPQFAPLDESGDIFLEMIDPNVLLPWGYGTAYAAQHVRFFMPLRTNPDAALIDVTGARVQPILGQLIGINLAVPYSAVNLGASPRIALVIDAKPRQA